MADDVAPHVSVAIYEYHRLAAEYQACVVRCQQANDQLQACEREYRRLARILGANHTPAPAPEFRVDTAISELSPRELEVFALIGQGLTTSDVSQRLNLNPSTVETYRARLKSKLNIASAPALIREAALWVSRTT